MSPPVFVRPGEACGYVCLIGRQYWTASTDLPALLAYAEETARNRKTVLLVRRNDRWVKLADHRPEGERLFRAEYHGTQTEAG